MRSRWLAAFSLEERRVEHLVLGPADGAEDGARPELAGQRQVLLAQDLLHQRLLVVRVVDDEAAVDPDGRAVLAQDPRAQRVERAGLDVAAALADEADDPLAQLRGGLVGEGDGQDPERRHALDPDQVGDPVGQDPRLAGARAGQDEQRTLGGRDRASLLRIERLDDLGGPFLAAFRRSPRGPRWGPGASDRGPAGARRGATRARPARRRAARRRRPRTRFPGRPGRHRGSGRRGGAGRSGSPPHSRAGRLRRTFAWGSWDGSVGLSAGRDRTGLSRRVRPGRRAGASTVTGSPHLEKVRSTSRSPASPRSRATTRPASWVVSFATRTVRSTVAALRSGIGMGRGRFVGTWSPPPRPASSSGVSSIEHRVARRPAALDVVALDRVETGLGEEVGEPGQDRRRVRGGSGRQPGIRSAA